MITIVILISFILDNLVSVISGNIIPLFTIMSLIIVYPYFNNNDSNYFKVALLIGLLYDVVFTDTLFLNMVVFLLLALIIRRLNLVLSNNIINIILMSFIVSSFYQIFTYIVLSLINYLSFDMSILIHSIIMSQPLNISYAVVTYILTDYFSRKYRILKID